MTHSLQDLFNELKQIAETMESTQDLDLAMASYKRAILVGKSLQAGLQVTQQNIKILNKEAPWETQDD